MNLKTFHLAMRWLWREWRASEWYVVFIALLLAVTAVTALNFYTDRLLQGVAQQSAKILGGDLIVTSPSPIPEAWKKEAARLNLRTADMWVYPSVVSANHQLQLANIQAVSATYPLVGDVTSHLAPQTAWVDPRLLSLLKLHLNDTLTLGAAQFHLAKTLTNDLDASNLGWIIAPRVLIRLDDVPATRTVIPGSRVEYRLLLVGDTMPLQQFRTWILPQLNSSQRLLDISTQQTMLWNVLQRTQNYLQLVLLVGVMMSGVAIAMSIQQYMRRHYAHVALWRCFGAKEKQIIQIVIYQLIIMAFIAGALGLVLGYFTQALFANLFKSVFQFPLPNTTLSPVVLGFMLSALLLFLFAYPLISELPHTSPLYIWRHQLTASSTRSKIYWVIMIVVVIALLYWFMNYSLLTLFFIDVLLLSVGFLYALSLLLLYCIRIIMQQTEGVIRRGLSQLVHYPESVSIQIVGFTLVIMAIILLNMVRTDLVENWQQSLPTYSPNYFAFNIAPTDLPALQQFFHQQHIHIVGLYPMVRGRLIALNGKPIMSAVPPDSRGNNALHRDLNLSWMWQFPSDNKIVQGRSWSTLDQGKPLLSVEDRLAQDLQLKMGDELTFQIGSEIVSARISSIRTVEWSSFHPNFFVIFVPGILNHLPATYITSFHLLSNETNLLNQLVQQFPNITVIDLANVLNQLLNLIGKITLALQYIFLFSLGAGVLIFMTSLQASMDERRQTYHLLRVLGAGQRYINKSIMVEFICLGLVILSASFLLAWLIAWLLKQFIFGL